MHPGSFAKDDTVISAAMKPLCENVDYRGDVEEVEKLIEMEVVSGVRENNVNQKSKYDEMRTEQRDREVQPTVEKDVEKIDTMKEEILSVGKKRNKKVRILEVIEEEGSEEALGNQKNNENSENFVEKESRRGSVIVQSAAGE